MRVNQLKKISEDYLTIIFNVANTITTLRDESLCTLKNIQRARKYIDDISSHSKKFWFYYSEVNDDGGVCVDAPKPNIQDYLYL